MDGSIGRDALGEGSEPTGELCPQSMSWQLSTSRHQTSRQQYSAPTNSTLTHSTPCQCAALPCHAMEQIANHVVSSLCLFPNRKPCREDWPSTALQAIAAGVIGKPVVCSHVQYICSTGLTNMTLDRSGSQ